MLTTRLNNLVDLNNLSSLNSLVKLFYSCHSEEAFNREFAHPAHQLKYINSPLTILEFLMHIAEISSFNMHEIFTRIQSGSMYEPGVALVDGLSCVCLAEDGIGSFYITAAALNNQMLDSVDISIERTRRERVDTINLFQQLLDSSLFQYEDRSNVIRPVVVAAPIGGEITLHEDDKMNNYRRYMHQQILVPHFIESLGRIDAIRRGRPLGRTPVPVVPRSDTTDPADTTDPVETKDPTLAPRVESKGGEIVHPYSDIKVGDTLQIAILRPVTSGTARVIAESGVDLMDFSDPYGSAIGLPIRRQAFEQHYRSGDTTLYILVEVQVARIERTSQGEVHYKILTLPQDVRNTLPIPYGIEIGFPSPRGVYNSQPTKFSTSFRDYVKYDEIISVVNRRVTLRDTPIIGDVVDPNAGRKSDGGQTGPLAGTVVEVDPNAGRKSDGGQTGPLAGTVVEVDPNAGRKSDGGETGPLTGTVVGVDPNAGRKSDGGETGPVTGTVVGINDSSDGPSGGTGATGVVLPLAPLGPILPAGGTGDRGSPPPYSVNPPPYSPSGGTGSIGVVLPSAPLGPILPAGGTGNRGTGDGGTGNRGGPIGGPRGGTGNRGTGDGGTGDGGTGNRGGPIGGPRGGTGDGDRGSGYRGPGDGGPGDGGETGPNGQGNANQLPEDPLLYSQPKFGAWWQVYPGMYQPGLRVMADTGVGVAEWLRHLGRPNPLPVIRGTGAGAGGGNGGEKIHEDDNMIMNGGRRNRNKRKTFKKRRKRKNKTSKRKKKKKRRKKKN